MYTSTGNEEVLERMDYMLSELKRAQDVYGTGYIGGVPGRKELWKEIESGQLDPGSFSLNETVASLQHDLDRVNPGEQQPEADHFIESENSNIAVNRDRHWRDAESWFSYGFVDKEKQARKPRITYFGEDINRKFRF